MGMYDYLGKTQVKCFYEPIVTHELKDFPNLQQNPITSLDYWPTMGSLRKFHFMSEVPYKTMWYDYGKTFMVFDPLDVEKTGLVHVIRNGRYMWSAHYTKLNTIVSPIIRVISKIGDELNITRKEQFSEILSDRAITFASEREVTKEFWKNPEYKDMDTSEAYKLLNEKLAPIRKEFSDKWVKPDQEIQKGWRVGGFLYGLSLFCEDDVTAHKYVELFKESLDNKDIEDVIDEYTEWCSNHGLKIYHADLWNFFMNFPTVKNLEKLIIRNPQ